MPPSSDLNLIELERSRHSIDIAYYVAGAFALIAMVLGRLRVSRFWLLFCIAFGVICLVPFWPGKYGTWQPFGTPYVYSTFGGEKVAVLAGQLWPVGNDKLLPDERREMRCDLALLGRESADCAAVEGLALDCCSLEDVAFRGVELVEPLADLICEQTRASGLLGTDATAIPTRPIASAPGRCGAGRTRTG